MIVGMLKNTSTKKLHPILFRPAPLPGGSDAGMQAQRYKSAGHHTQGFDTDDAALTAAHELCKQVGADYRPVAWEWDGDGVPALVVFFEPIATPCGAGDRIRASATPSPSLGMSFNDVMAMVANDRKIGLPPMVKPTT